MLNYSVSMFLPDYWSNEAPLYSEKLIPLLDNVLSDNFSQHGKLSGAYYELLDKVLSIHNLDPDCQREYVRESGLQYILDFFDPTDEQLSKLISLLVLIHHLKGTKKGLEIILSLMDITTTITEWWEDDPITYEENTFRVEIDASTLTNAYDIDVFIRFKQFIENYVYPTSIFIRYYNINFGITFYSDIQGQRDQTAKCVIANIENFIYQKLSQIVNINSESNIKRLIFFNETGAVTTLTDISGNDNATLSGNAEDLSPAVEGSLCRTLDFTSNAYYEFSDSDDLSFGDGSTDSGFSVIVLINPNSSTDCVLSKFDNTTGSTENEWSLEWGSNKLYFICYDNSTGGKISRYYNSDLSGDVGSFHTYITTYSGNSNSSGMKIYRDGTQIDDTDNNSGSYVAMENMGSLVGNFGKNTVGARYAIGSYIGAVVAIVSKELSGTDVSDINTLLQDYVSTLDLFDLARDLL